jgi:hypothetical protein
MFSSGETVFPGVETIFLSAPPTSTLSPELKPHPAAVLREAAHAANISYEIISVIFMLSSHMRSIVGSHHSCRG